jgi:hypothetical protein
MCAVAMNDTTAQRVKDLDIVRDATHMPPAAKISEILYTRLSAGFYGDQAPLGPA